MNGFVKNVHSQTISRYAGHIVLVKPRDNSGNTTRRFLPVIPFFPLVASSMLETVVKPAVCQADAKHSTGSTLKYSTLATRILPFRPGVSNNIEGWPVKTSRCKIENFFFFQTAVAGTHACYQLITLTASIEKKFIANHLAVTRRACSLVSLHRFLEKQRIVSLKCLTVQKRRQAVQCRSVFRRKWLLQCILSRKNIGKRYTSRNKCISTSIIVARLLSHR